MRRGELLITLCLSALFAAPTFAQVGVCTSANQQNCYRFLCNGMDADGSIRNSCNTCSDSTAPRWYQATVPVRVDRSTVPPELGTTAWNSVVDGCFDGWANVSTSNLVFQDIGAATTRGFGTNETQHEIFWITNATEWQQKVGGGVNGALGVTLPLFGCGSPGQIFDADLAMNGVGFDWVASSADCQAGFCNSARSTLLHELGHFIGLGHPCSLCSWSVMSAQSGYDPEYPLGVDQAALTALYPGEPGGLGYGCSGNGDCNQGLDCITANNLSYCSQSCGTCPEGFECTAANGGNYCTFSAGELAGAVGEGESCAQRPCVEGLLCVGGGGEYTCSAPCDPNGANTCSNGYSCFELQGGGGACFNIAEAQAGQFCDNATVVCASGLSCVAETPTAGYCRRDCDPNNGTGCVANEQCLPLVDQNNNVVGGACFPYGNVQEGGSCSGPTDCARGNVCLIDGANNAAHCYLRCDDGFSCVSAQQQCISLGDVSYCDPLSASIQPENDAGPGPGPGSDAGSGNEGGPSPPPPGGCRLLRGNYDCPNGQGCVDDGDGDGIGGCQQGAEGETGTGGLCEDASECTGGICHNGVCTRPCDIGEGCVEGYECDAEAIPGGLCKAKSCKDDPGACGDGYSCQYSSAQRYVCAVGGKTGPCACTASPGDSESGGPMGLAALAVLGLALLRRRRDA